MLINMFFDDPLEQFIITEINAIFCRYFWRIFNNNVLINLLWDFFVCLTLYQVFYKTAYVQFVFYLIWLQENLNQYVYQNLKDKMYFFRISFFFFLFYVLFIIGFYNIISLVAYNFTLTSHILFTFILSNLLFFFINRILLQRFGISLLNLFVPTGTPLQIVFFVILIETISYIARIFSLGIRLFANMSSGHILLAIIATFAIQIIFVKNLGLLLLLIIILVLEFFISNLQAYVFFMLSNIYFKEALYLH